MKTNEEEELRTQSSTALLNARRRDTIFNPKKDLQQRALQLRNAIFDNQFDDIDADTIFDLITVDQDISEEKKLEYLRELPVSLNIKRQVLEKLDTARRIQLESRAAGFLLRWQLTTRSLSYDFRNFLYTFELWREPITKIQKKLGTNVASYFYFLRWLLFLNSIHFTIMMLFVVFPQSQDEIYEENQTFERSIFIDLLTGTGRYTDSYSLLYFGSYSSDLIDDTYNMPLAYLVCIVVIWIVTLIVISVTLTAAYPNTYVDSALERKNIFFNKVFTAWDHSIMSEETAALHKRGICEDIQYLVHKKKTTSTSLTDLELLWKKVSFVVVNLLSLAIIGAFGYVTYLELEKRAHLSSVAVFDEMTFALMVSVGSVLFLYLLKFFEMFETYLTPRTRSYFTMVKVLLLRIVNLGIVTYFWMIVYRPPRDEQVCYENELGSEFYRLIMVHFLLVMIVFLFLGEFVRKLLHRYATERIPLKEFDVPYSVLDLVYFQTLAWLAMFCVPLVPAMMIVLLVTLFYSKKHSALTNCRAPQLLMSPTDAHFFYVCLVFVVFFLSALIVAYTIFGLPTSDCGAFEEYLHAGDIIRELLYTKKRESVVWDTLTDAPILFAAFCGLCLVAHYVKCQADAHVRVIQKIQQTIIQARKDRAYMRSIYDQSVNAAQGRDKNA